MQKRHFAEPSELKKKPLKKDDISPVAGVSNWEKKSGDREAKNAVQGETIEPQIWVKTKPFDPLNPASQNFINKNINQF